MKYQYYMDYLLQRWLIKLKHKNEKLLFLYSQGVDSIDSKFISESVAWDIIRYWEKFGPIVKIGRRVTNNLLAFDDMEKVYPRLRQQYQQRIDALTRTTINV